MELPEPRPMLLPPGVDLMAHQARLLASVAEGHRTFLLADEPGLGKTAQALLAAQVANAYPLLAIVPNVVKTNWAREAEMWTPHRSVTVIHGDGDTVVENMGPFLEPKQLFGGQFSPELLRGFRGSPGRARDSLPSPSHERGARNPDWAGRRSNRPWVNLTTGGRGTEMYRRNQPQSGRAGTS